MQNLSLDLRNRFGEDILAKVIKEDSKQDDCDYIIIDGVRRVKDIKYFLTLSEFKLISIDADIKIRYERMVERNENEGDDKKTFSEFEAECSKEAEKEIPEVMKIADYTINNNKDFDHLYQQIDEIISKINS
jgi:dephospho-CoA kinase